MKVMTVVGTRPEIIRLSRIISEIELNFSHVLVHTGQNYDFQLSQVFFDELGISAPNHYLNADTTTLGSTLGSIISGIENIIDKESPDAFLVLGDTNSAISAIMAKRKHIPVFHLEAGNRSFDENVPEETNRRMIDHISDFNLVYSEHARRNLLGEGLHPRRIYLTGSPMFEVIEYYRSNINSSSALSTNKLESKGFLLASVHREENVENSVRLHELLCALQSAGAKFNCKVLLSTHPRTRNRLNEIIDFSSRFSNILIHEPFGFFDYCKLQQESICVLSDSGTISEESSILGFPAVTLRNSIERPEALDSGSIICAGVNEREVLDAIDISLRTFSKSKSVPAEYRITDTSIRVARLLQSVAPFHRLWSGLYEKG